MRLIIKARTRPIGSVSPDGKYKKAPSGEWLPIKKERDVGNMLESKIKESYEWIFSQTDNEFEALVLLDESGKVLKTRLGDKASIEVTDLHYKMHGAIFLHNHPNGTSLSDNDIWCAIVDGVKEIRAVGEKYEYIFQPAKMLPKLTANIEERKRMINFFHDKAQELYRKNMPKVEAGKMSATDANMNHWHAINKSFVKEFGGSYERRER